MQSVLFIGNKNILAQERTSTTFLSYRGYIWLQTHREKKLWLKIIFFYFSDICKHKMSKKKNENFRVNLIYEVEILKKFQNFKNSLILIDKNRVD